MPRPRLPDDQRRTERINLRLSSSDLERIGSRISPGASLCAYIREQAIRRPRPQPVAEVSRTGLDALLEHARRINEAAHAANRGESATISNAELAEVCGLLRLLGRRIRG